MFDYKLFEVYVSLSDCIDVILLVWLLLPASFCGDIPFPLFLIPRQLVTRIQFCPIVIQRYIDFKF